MATKKEIIYDVLEHLNAYSDDIKFSEEHISFIIDNKRNMLLSQYLSNLKKEIPQEAIQSICLPLEIDKNCFEDIQVLKSKIKIPSTLENTGRNNIIQAYTGSRFFKNLNIVDYSRLPFLASEKYNDNMLYLSIDPKSYLVVYNKKNNHLLLEQLEIEGIFENPEEAYELSCDSVNNNCDFYDSQYPIKSDLIDIIVNETVKQLLIKYKLPTDNINNGEDILSGETKKK